MRTKPPSDGQELRSDADQMGERAAVGPRDEDMANSASDMTDQPLGQDAKASDFVAASPGSAEGPGREEILEPSSAVEVVRQTTVRVLGERIRLLGINRSGAYEHYDILLSRGFPIAPGEIAVLELVRSRFPNLKSYHEIGSGLGTLPLMLAHDGFAAVGVERDDRRHLTATAILRELSTELPHIESNCRLIGAEFPAAVADLDVSDSMAILTDFVASQEAYPKLCRGLARYRYVLLDLQRFCFKRDSTKEQEQLVEELAGYGLAPRDDIIDLEYEGYYRLFERTSLAERLQDDELAERLGGTADAARAEPMPEVSGNQVEPATAGRRELALISEAGVPAQIPEAGVLAHTPEVQPEASLSAFVLPPNPQRARRPRFGGWLALSALLVIGIPSLLAVAYFGFWASSQYVTTFQFAVRGPSQAAAARAGGGASGQGVGAMSPDAFVVTDYINSPQAIADVGRDVDLRAIFSKLAVDFWSRLPPNITPEDLNAYWSGKVSAYFDLISGNVSVSVRAFTPKESLELAQALIASSDQMFRRLNVQAQQDFVRLADDYLKRAEQQLAKARQAVLEFREGSGLVDPEKTAQAGSAIIDELRKQLAGFQGQYASVQAVSPRSPNLAALNSQIVALENQIKSQEQLGSSAVKAVTADTLGKYQSLDLERQFAEKQYTEALGLRNQVYLTAQNQQSYLALFVEPTLPQTSRYPDRPKAIASVMLAAAAAWFIGMLITYAVRDHLM